MIKHSALIKGLIITIIGLHPMIVFSGDNNIKQSNPLEIHIRSLAASCAACHGTNGNTVNISSQFTDSVQSGKPKKLAGIDSQYFVEQMLAFRADERIGTVMNHHAKGLNDAEIEALGQYFLNQSQQDVVTFPSQMLLKTHLH